MTLFGEDVILSGMFVFSLMLFVTTAPSIITTKTKNKSIFLLLTPLLVFYIYLFIYIRVTYFVTGLTFLSDANGYHTYF